VTRTIPLPPKSRTNVFTGAIPELVNASFSIVVDATLPIIAERAMYFGGPRFWEGGHASPGVTESAREWFLAEGATGFFDEYVMVGNPNATIANVTLTYLLTSGQSLVRTRVMQPNSRLTVAVASEDPLLAGADVSTRVSSDVPVIAERSMYWPAPFPAWKEAHNSFGLTETATMWGLANIQVGDIPRYGGAYSVSTYSTYILLANPNANDAEVQITYTGGNFRQVRTHTVAKNSRKTVAIVPGAGSDVPADQRGRLSAVIEVLNGQPIAVERAVYSGANGEFWSSGTNVTATKIEPRPGPTPCECTTHAECGYLGVPLGRTCSNRSFTCGLPITACEIPIGQTCGTCGIIAMCPECYIQESNSPFAAPAGGMSVDWLRRR
jgi:hypothetical protein